MRIFFRIVCLVCVGFAGWIAGSFYPAPQAWLDQIRHSVSDIQSSQDDVTSDDAPPDPTPVEPVPAFDSSDAEPTSDQIRTWIAEARAEHPYRESEERMYAVMMCESGGQASIVNPVGPYTGLFQYSEGTWNGDWNDYRAEGILNARAQVFATALAWTKDMQGHWGCYTRSE
ncbi:MAG: hypothetical protein AAF216_03445 [Pseudomonadota bacterium]